MNITVEQKSFIVVDTEITPCPFRYSFEELDSQKYQYPLGSASPLDFRVVYLVKGPLYTFRLFGQINNQPIDLTKRLAKDAQMPTRYGFLMPEEMEAYEVDDENYWLNICREVIAEAYPNCHLPEVVVLTGT